MSAPGPHRPYQGYPYVNQIVTDVPTVGRDAAMRWQHLPRRQMTTDGAGSSGLQSSRPPIRGIVHPSLPPKRDPDETPVVYIDIPDSHGSDVTQDLDAQNSDEGSFVQDTIMYDPFENRRIAVGKRPEDNESNCSTLTDGSTYSNIRYPQSPGSQRHQYLPKSPCAQDLASQPYSPDLPNKTIPEFMMNETGIYRGDSSNGHQGTLGPNYPEPPPAYSESQGQISGTQGPTPPRTQVITTNFVPEQPPIGLQHQDRKFMVCHHCGKQVHTLVIKELSVISHIFAVILFLLCPPLVLLVHCTDYFKQKNHYCPNCNKMIGFVRPVIGQELNLTV